MKYIHLILLFILIGFCFSTPSMAYSKPLKKTLTLTAVLRENEISNRHVLIIDTTSSLVNFRQIKDQNLGKDFLKHASVFKKERAYKSDNKKTEVITYMVLKQSVQLNCLVLKESSQFEPVIESMDIVLSNHGTEVRKITITSVGHKRILTFPITEVSELSFIITAAKMKPHLEDISGYLVDEKLAAKIP